MFDKSESQFKVISRIYVYLYNMLQFLKSLAGHFSEIEFEICKINVLNKRIMAFQRMRGCKFYDKRDFSETLFSEIASK